MSGTSQTKAKNKYNLKAYDRINLTVFKGQKAVINDIAAQQGESLNGYIKKAVQAQVKTDTGKDIEL